ncbi:hypothetical protein GGQ99_002797 [Aminobacter niigataensis]|uniref:Thermonuclease family protein n=1 Tax=Aminobacter niigataensis TaxID=83265 RepID=A0ABR6L2L2_9HYPH|nr:thermonuclease family protein [Aminobacter niigataensis]MBB4651034.1 hypothetical protein [Aminobacter niigataensis]
MAISAVALTIMAAKSVHLPPPPVLESVPAETLSLPSPRHQGAGIAVAEVPPSPARSIAPDIVAPPEVARLQLERIEARPPLGDLGLAPPPKRVGPDDWEGTLLYRPVVTSSASFEAMGYVIFVAGAEAIDPGQTCRFEGVAWRCGERAMLAFRYWLRGRAPLCQVFPPAERQPVAAACRIGKQDVGAWLVSNGWAHALPGGGYEKAEEVARKAGMGVFGPPD